PAVALRVIGAGARALLLGAERARVAGQRDALAVGGAPGRDAAPRLAALEVRTVPRAGAAGDARPAVADPIAEAIVVVGALDAAAAHAGPAAAVGVGGAAEHAAVVDAGVVAGAVAVE